jgi:hypothetical protein
VEETAVADIFAGKTALITPEHSAAALLALLAGNDTGAIWDVSPAPAGA